MEVSRRPDTNRWESNGAGTASTPSEIKPSEDDLQLADATGCASSLMQRHRGTTSCGDVIDGLLEAFQREWMTLRPNGRMQSNTIWRNGNDRENFFKIL